MKKNLFKTRLLSFAAFCGLALALASCANEDVVQSTTGTDNDKNLTTFVAGDEAKTRTSMDYTSGAFFWEAGDKIWVKDDDGTWQQSNNAPTAKVASFSFKVPGKFNNSASYTVYYPGKNGSQNNVTIPAAQSQSEPNSTAHFGESGDCGTATATGTLGGGAFSFTLDHQAAILVFQPYTSNTVVQGCYLTKIEVNSDNDITNTYTLDPITGELTGTGTGKQIVLTTKGSGSYADGFPLTNSSVSMSTNGAYMLIKPGTHTFKIRYWVKDIATNVEGTITKILGSHTYAKNTYYDMIANLNVREYDGMYYMWDAQKNYWYGHEWNSASPWQPVLNGNSNPNYPQNNSDVLRWYHEGNGLLQATQTCATLPNANELSWYCMYGDPRRDRDELWTTMGHLYKGGMWFKKKAVLQAEGHYDTEKSADGSTDMRTTYKYYVNSNNSISDNILPSAADAGNYFYLPALGYYFTDYGFTPGELHHVGERGYFWSSSAYPWGGDGAYYLYIELGAVAAGNGIRKNGFTLGAFE